MSRRNGLQKSVGDQLDRQWQHTLEMRKTVLSVKNRSTTVYGQLRSEQKVNLVLILGMLFNSWLVL